MQARVEQIKYRDLMLMVKIDKGTNYVVIGEKESQRTQAARTKIRNIEGRHGYFIHLLSWTSTGS
ncbi:hypothetical protein SY87_07565 [Burkholderia pseudomallei]|nr:hypothetical protein SY87_07565 [Burkholderia pseudomallei]OMS94419.1 hypothetical protein AQ749_26825 [Burkholderia pseudomallei]OND90841.1 hypothetical protein AQ942_14455 [Burkholderia pseudomallei]